MAKDSKEAKYTVGRSAGSGVFTTIRAGQSETRVMSKRVYDEANARAGAKIREYVRDDRKAK